MRYLKRRRASAGGGFFARLLGRLVLLGGTPARLLRLGLLFLAGELDHREHRGVAAAMTELDHARVAAAALFEARRDLVEELFYRLVRLQRREGAAARGEVALLAERDHPVGDSAQFLGLGVGGRDPLVADQRQHHVLEQRLAMRRGAIELAARVEVTHLLLQTVTPTRGVPALPTCGRARRAAADSPAASRA